VVIKGKDFEQNPENTLRLQILGAVAEFEHAKITDRMPRGRLDRLRSGQIISQGGLIYGYAYRRKTPAAPPALVIHEEQTAVFHSIFEVYASGKYGLIAISRWLEERGILTRMGKRLWDTCRVKIVPQTQPMQAPDISSG
jgi:site-specific DNA recombinase